MLPALVHLNYTSHLAIHKVMSVAHHAVVVFGLASCAVIKCTHLSSPMVSLKCQYIGNTPPDEIRGMGVLKIPWYNLQCCWLMT